MNCSFVARHRTDTGEGTEAVFFSKGKPGGAANYRSRRGASSPRVSKRLQSLLSASGASSCVCSRRGVYRGARVFVHRGLFLLRGGSPESDVSFQLRGYPIRPWPFPLLGNSGLLINEFPKKEVQCLEQEGGLPLVRCFSQPRDVGTPPLRRVHVTRHCKRPPPCTTRPSVHLEFPQPL